MFDRLLNWIFRKARGQRVSNAPKAVAMIPVPSTNVRYIGYDDANQRLFITFWSGATYVYDQVPPEVHRDFMRARSKGRFVWRTIRGYGADGPYRYRKV